MHTNGSLHLTCMTNWFNQIQMASIWGDWYNQLHSYHMLPLKPAYLSFYCLILKLIIEKISVYVICLTWKEHFLLEHRFNIKIGMYLCYIDSTYLHIHMKRMTQIMQPLFSLHHASLFSHYYWKCAILSRYIICHYWRILYCALSMLQYRKFHDDVKAIKNKNDIFLSQGTFLLQ